MSFVARLNIPVENANPSARVHVSVCVCVCSLSALFSQFNYHRISKSCRHTYVFSLLETWQIYLLPDEMDFRVQSGWNAVGWKENYIDQIFVAVDEM
jgi:hypothetical protein